MSDVAFSAQEPLERRVIPLENLVPRSKPVQLFGHIFPKLFCGFDRLFISSFVVLQKSLLNEGWRWKYLASLLK